MERTGFLWIGEICAGGEKGGIRAGAHQCQKHKNKNKPNFICPLSAPSKNKPPLLHPPLSPPAFLPPPLLLSLHLPLLLSDNTSISAPALSVVGAPQRWISPRQPRVVTRSATRSAACHPSPTSTTRPMIDTRSTRSARSHLLYIALRTDRTSLGTRSLPTNGTLLSPRPPSLVAALTSRSCLIGIYS